MVTKVLMLIETSFTNIFSLKRMIRVIFKICNLIISYYRSSYKQSPKYKN